MDPPYPKSVSAPSTPTELTKQIHINSPGKKKKKLKVHFPDDDILVSCYLDPPDPWSKGHQLPVDTVLPAYVSYCEKQNIQPLLCVLDQLQEFQNRADECSNGQRVFDFSLVGEKLTLMQCEALEEVFRRIKFVVVDLDGCYLEDEQGAATIFDMIEYYDSAVQLNISFIKNIDCRGWQACSRMLKKTNALVHLNARNTGLSEQILLILGKALRLGSNLTTLHVENCGIFGRCLVILVAALKSNTTLRELFLAENTISSSDGFQLGNLLRTNTHLELLDLSNNKLQNEGLVHLMDSLGLQSNTSGRGLSTLILWNNELTREGMSCVAKALNSARTIKRFNLGNNNVTSEGIEELKSSFICNQTLEILELENCGLTTEGVIALAEYISTSSIMQKLDIRGNNISLAGLKALSQVLQINHSVISVQVDPTSRDLNESIDDRVNELQLINEYCNRNKEEQSYQPAQDVYLSTLFNGIFSRVLPSSNLIQSEGLTKCLIGGNTKRGRFQVLTVSLEEEKELLQNLVLSEEKIQSDEKINSDEKILDPRTRFFSELHFPTKPAHSPPAPTIPIDCKGSSEEPEEVVDSNDVFVDDSEGAFEKEAQPRRHSDVPMHQLQKLSPFLEDKDVSKSDDPCAVKLVKKGKPANLMLTLSVNNSTDLPHVELRERRLSSPNVPTEPLIFRKVHSIKCCKALESLDLCSSMPLSPTKLYENFSFPQPAVEEVPLRPQRSPESSRAPSYMVH